MMVKTFTIDFQAGPEGGYLVSARSSTRAATGHQVLSARCLEELLSPERIAAYENALTWDQVTEIGSDLFDCVFQGELKELFLECRAAARERREPLQVVLSFAPLCLLQEIPWELLFDGERFLALSSTTPLLREVRSRDAATELATPPPVRILFTAPYGGESDPLGVDEEEQVLRTVVAESDGLLDLQVVRGSSDRPLTVERLTQAFLGARGRRRPFRLWHHSGHGLLRTDSKREFFLVLQGSDGKPAEVPSASLRQWISDPSDLRLAVLNLCFSGSAVGLSSHLARLGLPVVIGMRRAVVNAAALAFTRTFYREITRLPVDVSLTAARHAMADRNWPTEWAQATLFSRQQTRLDLIATVEGAPGVPGGAGVRFSGTTTAEGDAVEIGRIGPGYGGVTAADVEFSGDTRVQGRIVRIGEAGSDLEALRATLESLNRAEG